MVELVDTRDLKSLDRNIVPVQVRPRVPSGKAMKNWLVVTYKKNELNRLQLNLRNQSFDYYLPKILTKNINSNHKEEVLFPGYIFVYSSVENYSAIRYTMGVKDIIKFGENIPYLTDSDIESIKKVEESSKINPIIKQVKIGQQLIVESGSLKGNIVTICKLSSKDRVEVLLYFLGSQRRVTILKKHLKF